MLENTFTVRHIIFTANVGMFQDEQTILNHIKEELHELQYYFLLLYMAHMMVN